MNRRLLIPLIAAGVALASGVASANASYWRQNGLLLEVSADPRDGTDFVQVDPTRAESLELIALNDVVRLRGLTLHFSDGRTMTRPMSFVRPGEPTRVDLPNACGAITSVELDYGRQIVDRTPARLQIVPRVDRGFDRSYGQRFDRDARYSTHDQPMPRVGTTQSYYQPAPSLTYQPVVRDHRNPYTVRAPQPYGWTIQGSVRF